MPALFLFIEKDSSRNNNLIAPNTGSLGDNWYVKELRILKEGNERRGPSRGKKAEEGGEWS